MDSDKKPGFDQVQQGDPKQPPQSNEDKGGQAQQESTPANKQMGGDAAKTPATPRTP